MGFQGGISRDLIQTNGDSPGKHGDLPRTLVISWDLMRKHGDFMGYHGI